jgi:hypothetical protein
VRHTAERFAADSDHPNYREVRLTETTYDSKPAALWEYTWGADTDLHAVWLLVRDDDRAYVLNYQTTETNWSGMQSELGQLQGGFTPPKNS